MLLVTIIGGYVAAFRIFDINEKAGIYINKQISQSLGIDVSFDSVYILPWSIRINNINLNFADAPGGNTALPLRINARQMRIAFNIITLLRNRLRPVLGTQKIFIDEPRFIWLLDHERERRKTNS